MKLISALNNLYLSTQPKPWKPKKPIVIQFPVNDVCNAKCQMCNIWQQKFDYQITPSELTKVLANPLFSEVRTVGVNGGEPTLRQDLPELVDVLFKELPNLSRVSLITNSLNSSQVIERIRKIGQVAKSHAGRLDVMVSLDGVGDVHDQVRGRRGNFDHAVRVIEFIQMSDLVSGSRLGCTVIKSNVYGLHDLLEFAICKDIPIKYRIGIPHQRLYSKDITDPFALDFQEKYHFSIFLENLIKYYEKSQHQKFFYRSLIDQLMYHKPRAAGCDWQHQGVTLSARGELLYCAVESKTLGSAITQDSEHLYQDNQEHLADIVRTKCSSCMHDYVGLPSTRLLLESYTNSLIGKLGLSSLPATKLPALKPLKQLKQQLGFRQKMVTAGIDLAALSKPQSVTSFSKSHVSKRKVLICGWYGTETLGDKAILGGVVNSIQAALGDFELHIASLEMYISQMTVLQMPELQGCTLHPVTDAINLASSMDLVVFGGGPLMAVNPLVEMIAIFQKAVEAKVPALIAGCGVGPLGAPHYNKAIQQLLQLASHRIYRDHKSTEIARSLGIDTTNDQVAEDPAFTWLEACQSTSTHAAAPQSDEHRPTLLLGLRDWPHQQFAPELSSLAAQQLKRRFEQEVVAALEVLLHRYPDLNIIPFPMCTNHIGHDDRWFYRDLFRNSGIQDALDLTVLGAELSPIEAVNVFKTASVALTMRFHSLVFAIATGIPAVSIDYTLGRGKVKSLADQYHVPQMSLDSITCEFMVSSLSTHLDINHETQTFAGPSEPLTFKGAVDSFLSLNA